MSTTRHPKLIIVGGPNGSDKTTFAIEYLQHEKLIYLSADAIAYEIDSTNPNLRAIKAGRCINRITERVQKGGHHVPSEDVRRRFYRSRNNFFYPHIKIWQ